MTQRIVVVGADAAGASAASTIKRRQPDWDVVVLEKSQDTSYAACGLPYWVAGQVPTRADLIAGKYLLVQRGKKNYYLVIAE